MYSLDQNKIAMFVGNDLIGLLMLNSLIPVITALGYEPVIFNTDNHKNRQFKIPTPKAISFFNTTLLEKIITPYIDDTPSKHLKNVSYDELYKKYNLSYHDIENVNAPDFVDMIKNDASFCGAISIRLLQIFEQDIISTFEEKGFIWNLHSGLTPKYKGLLIPYRAIQNGEKEYGLTLHEMDCDIDTGAIIKQAALPLDKTKPVLELYIDTIPSAVNILTMALNDYKKNGFVHTQRQAQTDVKKTYYSNPTEEEFKEFMANGIFYADPFETPELLTKIFFSDNDNIMAAGFKKKLEQSITHYMSPTKERNRHNIIPLQKEGMMKRKSA